ncbi:PrsW family intramembrane metalloprotease [Halorientalis marina]|uniref:PrsW family intramembrane metalloprotease n=1 Tax=Halorientalis marina TaxID=2931976 RepID=UPI001FF5D8A1|nr:PrsW family glutamic-type intramembrane protease [Halorientalis marina]
MTDRRDPVEAKSDGSVDLYEISDWEVRSGLDRFAVWLYGGLVSTLRWTVVGAAVLIVLAEFALGGLGLVTDPVVGTFVVLSVVPALGLAAYLWYADVTTQEPLGLLIATFVLGVLLASFAGVLNPILGGYASAIGSGFGLVPVFGTLAFFFFVVGPIEETVKILAVRLHAYRDDRFDAVIDGAVYGAVAGLGFATIENALYITQTLGTAPEAANLIGEGSGIATVRALAGPGHVIYSAFAGYYLGLAKFNRDRAGPIVLKGLIIATLIHGTYNTTVTILVPAVASTTALSGFVAFFGFVILYDGLFGLLLIRKLSKYNSAFRTVSQGDGPASRSEPPEFE